MSCTLFYILLGNKTKQFL